MHQSSHETVEPLEIFCFLYLVLIEAVLALASHVTIVAHKCVVSFRAAISLAHYAMLCALMLVP